MLIIDKVKIGQTLVSDVERGDAVSWKNFLSENVSN